MSKGASIWYLGRVAQRRGKFASVSVIAREESQGWEALENPRKIFQKLGQVELAGIKGMDLHPGECLAFQATANTRPGGASYRVTRHRVLPHFADLAFLGSLEAARVLFTKTGWDGGKQSGQWVVRFSVDHVIVLSLKLDRGAKKLVAVPNGLATVQCCAFEEQRIIHAPSEDSPLYELDGAQVLATYDWSPGADYIAHVIRALAGADDPRLPELITWLELHRDEETGRVSVTGADQEKAFEALRSGELAARLSADRELMAEYLAAVQDDPAVAKAVADAAADLASHDKEALLSKLRSEAVAEIASERQLLQDELDAERTRMQAEVRDQRLSLEQAMRERLAQKEAELEEDIQQRIRAKIEASQQSLQEKADELARVVKAIEETRQDGEAARAALQTEIAQFSEELGELQSKRTSMQAQLAELSDAAGRLQARSEPGLFLDLPQQVRSQTIDLKTLGKAIAAVPILSKTGKSLMRRFVAFMLAGEVPILAGAERDDFILIAETLVASRRLLQFDADATVLTTEDIWSRPGSGLTSVVGRAAQSAAAGDATFLVELRGIDRSAARFWYPSLVSYCRKGLLPRRLLMFATVVDESSDETKALPEDACWLKADDVVVAGAALVAPNVLGGGSGSIAFDFDPGPRPEDLSAALPVLTELTVKLDLPMSLRIARVAVESTELNLADRRETFAAAQDFCRAINRLDGMRLAEKQSA